MSLNKLADLVSVRNQLALLSNNTNIVKKDSRREIENILAKMDKVFLEHVRKLNLAEEMMSYMEEIARRDSKPPTKKEEREIKNALKKLPPESKKVVSKKTVDSQLSKEEVEECLTKPEPKEEMTVGDIEKEDETVDDQGEPEDLTDEEKDRKLIAESIAKAKADIKPDAVKSSGFKRIDED